MTDDNHIHDTVVHMMWNTFAHTGDLSLSHTPCHIASCRLLNISPHFWYQTLFCTLSQWIHCNLFDNQYPVIMYIKCTEIQYRTWIRITRALIGLNLSTTTNQSCVCVSSTNKKYWSVVTFPVHGYNNQQKLVLFQYRPMKSQKACFHLFDLSPSWGYAYVEYLLHQMALSTPQFLHDQFCARLT